MESFEMSKLHPGYPRQDVSCPGCGREYGAYGRKVCRNCQECEKCCACNKDKKDIIPATQFVSEINES